MSNRFIKIFRLEEADNTIFSNYQRYDFYQLIWFKNVGGDNLYYLDFHEYELKDNQIILIFPGQIDRLNVKDKKGFIYTIHNENFFRMGQRLNSDYLNGYFSNIFITPDNNTTDVLNKINELMLSEYYSKNRITLLEIYMESFLFHVSSYFESSDTYKNKTDSIIPELMRLIDKNFIIQRETDFYAQELGYSPKKINQICIKGTGKTIKGHIQERLILEIKKEIRLGNKSLKEIAFELGFNEPAYFTRFFKLHTSQTPKDFRDN